MLALSDVCGTVTISKTEYEKLIKKSEQVEIIKRMCERPYLSDDDVRVVLGIEKKCEGGTNNAEKL